MTMMMAIKCAITLFLSLSLSNVLSATTGTIKLISPDGLLMTSDQVKNFMSSKQGMKEIHSTSIIKTYDGESNLFDSSFGVKFGPGKLHFKLIVHSDISYTLYSCIHTLLIYV